MGSHAQSSVTDASLDLVVYRELARRQGWQIHLVMETHVHADHLSRARALARDTGATLHLPETDRVSFEYAPLRDGDVVRVGSDRKSTRLNSSHGYISYAVFCLKKKKTQKSQGSKFRETSRSTLSRSGFWPWTAKR